MPRKATTKTTVKDNNAGVVENTTPEIVTKSETVEIKEEIKIEEPLKDSDEIMVQSLISNVSYFDKATSYTYEWESVGDVEMLTFATLKAMWINYKTYFAELWLRPLDERVIKYFKLEKLYASYDIMLDSSNYTRDNLDKIVDLLKNINPRQTGLFNSIVSKVKGFVSNGDVSDVIVIRSLERYLNVDLFGLIRE